MYLRIHESMQGRIVAVCDENLMGKVLEGKGAYMDLSTHGGFYAGEKADDARVRKALEKFDSANLVGKESVAIAVSMGLCEKKDVMYIKKTPYIQIYRL
ncbi:MAG: DUF424 family protein [Candidatus Micrarchaeota archaeon]